MSVCPQPRHKIAANIFSLNFDNTPRLGQIPPENGSFSPFPKTFLRSNRFLVTTRITKPKSNFPSNVFLRQKPPIWWRDWRPDATEMAYPPQIRQVLLVLSPCQAISASAAAATKNESVSRFVFLAVSLTNPRKRRKTVSAIAEFAAYCA